MEYEANLVLLSHRFWHVSPIGILEFEVVSIQLGKSIVF